MRAFIVFVILVSLDGSAVAQVLASNRLYSKIRKESYDGAIRFATKTIDSYRGKKKYYRKATPLLMGLGMVYKKTGNYTEAEKNYFEAYTILKYREAKGKRMRVGDIDVLDELGLMYLETGNFDEARDLIRRAYHLREKRFSSTNLLRYRSHLVYGNYFYRIRQLDSAYYFLKEYVFYIKNSNHTTKEELNRYADTYRILAELEMERDNVDQAMRFARKNRKLQHHRWTKKEAGRNNINKVLSLNLVSASYRLSGDTERALQYNDRAFKRYDQTIKATSHHQIPLLVNRALIFWDAGNFDEAEKNFLQATQLQNEFVSRNFSSLSEYEKENFYSAMRKNFDYLNAFAIDKMQNYKGFKPDSIFSVVYDFHIANKAIILNESNRMLSILQNTTDKELKNQFEEWRLRKNELAKKMVVDAFSDSDEDVRQLKATINRLEKEMGRKTALFDSAAQKPTWRDVRRELKATQAAVEIIRAPVYGIRQLSKNGKKRSSKKGPTSIKALLDSAVYLVMIVKPQTIEGPEKLVIGNGRELETRAFRYYQNNNLFKLRDLKSYEAFWAPIAKKLGGAKQVFVSSDGVYNLINLWLLEEPRGGERLIDQVDIINVTNTRLLLNARDASFSASSATLLGRPDYTGDDAVNADSTDHGQRSVDDLFRQGVSDLPGTEVEVRAISDFFARNNITADVLLENDASEDNLKRSGSREIIHIATHGFFDTRQSGRSPMVRSGLLLAGVTSGNPNRKEDGILTAYEASNLDLQNTRLVVLSACETGLGEVRSGEGVYGLQRAFEVAGVDNILMSMWKVSDQATQELMVVFYRELLKLKNVNEAFKRAQQELRKKYPEPYYWGAFKLIGY